MKTLFLLLALALLFGCLGSPGAPLANSSSYAPAQAANSSSEYTPAQAANQNHSTPPNSSLPANSQLSANASAPATPGSSANGSVIVYFFYLSTCPFCNKQTSLANGALKSEFPQAKWLEYDVSVPANRAVWISMMGARNQTAKSVPVTIIGPDVISGYYPGQTETMIRASIKEQLRQKNITQSASQ